MSTSSGIQRLLADVLDSHYHIGPFVQKVAGTERSHWQQRPFFGNEDVSRAIWEMSRQRRQRVSDQKTNWMTVRGVYRTAAAVGRGVLLPQCGCTRHLTRHIWKCRRYGKG